MLRNWLKQNYSGSVFRFVSGLMLRISAVTASGVEAAERGGITLIGFAREGRMNIYTFPERVKG